MQRWEPGNISETVTVTAESTPLQSDTQVQKTIDTTDIQDLALNGRDPINLALLKTGVRGGTFNSFNPDSLTTGGYNVNRKLRHKYNLITVDGMSGSNPYPVVRSDCRYQNVDAIDEVQILTSNYLPEYGRASGGQIRFVTKSGGSQFRGSAFEPYPGTKSSMPTRGRATAAPSLTRTAVRPRSASTSSGSTSAGR